MKKSPSHLSDTSSKDAAQGPAPTADEGQGRAVDVSNQGSGHRRPTTFPSVGLVASAGGLDAFKKFFSAMPAENGMAFVLIPHLDPSSIHTLARKVSPNHLTDPRQQT
jgi:chemotaxis response regulator CheB